MPNVHAAAGSCAAAMDLVVATHLVAAVVVMLPRLVVVADFAMQLGVVVDAVFVDVGKVLDGRPLDAPTVQLSSMSPASIEPGETSVCAGATKKLEMI